MSYRKPIEISCSHSCANPIDIKIGSRADGSWRTVIDNRWDTE